MSVHDDRANPLRRTPEPNDGSPQAVALPTKRSPAMVLLRWLPIAIILVLAACGAMGVINSMMPPP